MHKARKSPVGKCIKNVYNLGIQHVKTGGYPSTALWEYLKNPQKHGYIHKEIPVLFTQFHQPNTQLISRLLPQEITQLYTLSTVPTITRTKEK